MIEDLCIRIKDKRRELGYSIEKVVSETKLHPAVIRDIESCNLDNITPIYIKGFIKIYASFLGVEIKDELEQIQKKIRATVNNPKQKKESGQNPIFNFFKIIIKSMTKLISKISPQVRKNILLAVIILLIFWLGFLGVRFSFRKVLGFFRNRKQAVSQQQVEKPAEEKNNQEPKPQLIGQLDQITAALTVKKPCFIKVISDGNLIFEGVLEKGEVETWRAEQELEFKISDGSAVYLEVDGQPIPKLSSIQKPIKSLIINSSGITVNK